MGDKVREYTIKIKDEQQVQDTKYRTTNIQTSANCVVLSETMSSIYICK